MLRIAIDGACRRNGKPDCVSAGGIFVQKYKDGVVTETFTKSMPEEYSTNQRGELLALILALETTGAEEAQIITDSEYIFNAMTKKWYMSWAANDWKTSSGDTAKNSDLWRRIADYNTYNITFYHIKGHCIPFGSVTANNLLLADSSGRELFLELCKKFDTVAPTKQTIFKNAQELSLRNNGFYLDAKTFKEFVAMNHAADIIANVEVNAADANLFTKHRP